jgi:hypothetical protein
LLRYLPMNSLTRLLWFCVWAGLITYLGLTLWFGIVGLTYPYQLDYGEGVVLWFAQQLARAQPIYKGLTGLPYASSNYPPVAMLLSAALMPLFGDGYISGRLLSFASALIVAALIYRIVRAETRDRRAGALSALFFLGSSYIYHWIPLFRVDLLGLAFTFGGVYVAWLWEKTADRRPQTADYKPTFYFVLFTFAFLLALYTKHTLFAAPLAVFCALWQRERRRALTFAFALGALGGAIYLALDAATSGGFTFGLLESNATVFLFGQLGALLQNFAVTFPVLLLFAFWGWITRVRAKRIGALEWYAVIAFAALAMSGRVGAWENYFFEALGVACVFAGFEFQVLGFRLPAQFLNFQVETLNLALPVLLLLQLALMWHDPRIEASLVARDFPANQELARLLARTPGTVISEDMGALATSAKPIMYYTFQYSSLARSGKWDQNWELNGLRDSAFPIVILERGTREDVDHYRRFTREFVSALDRYYARTQTIGKYEIYTPAPLAHLQSADFGDALALVGWSAQPQTVNPETLNLTVVWQAKRALTRRYTAFVHLEKTGGNKVTQDDHEPLGGIYPTTRWAVYEMVRDVYMLNIPRDLAPGKYAVRVGWYDAETGDRLPVPGSADDTVILTTFER